MPNALAYCGVAPGWRDRKSTRLNSSHSQISYAVFCLKKKMMVSAALPAEDDDTAVIAPHPRAADTLGIDPALSTFRPQRGRACPVPRLPCPPSSPSG